MRVHFLLLTLCCLASCWPMPEEHDNEDSVAESNETSLNEQTLNLRSQAELVPPYLAQYQKGQEDTTEVEAVTEEAVADTTDLEYRDTTLQVLESVTDGHLNGATNVEEENSEKGAFANKGVTVIAESTDEKHSAYQSINGGSCFHECVPYYLCHNGEIVTDGAGIIDIRLGSTGSDPDVERVGGNCPGYLEVCCRDPSKEIVIPIKEIPTYEPSCGKHNADGVVSRIAGFSQNETQFGEFPWMAIILTTESKGGNEYNIFQCGGSLIEPDVVLTAAHCVAGKDPLSLKVRLGEWDTQKTSELYQYEDVYVKELVYHEHFNGRSLLNDVALLFLEEQAELNYHVDTVCLPEESQNFTDASCYATGWGKDTFGEEGRYQNVMKKVSLPLVDHDDCELALQSTRLSKYFRLHHSFTCAGGAEGEDTCKGDGGGPLVCPDPYNPNRYVQVGITAWGISCGEEGIPGVYADVRKFTSWILKTMEDYYARSTPQEQDSTATPK